jgi:uncharacterized protein
MKVVHIIAFILLVIGGLNWLLVAFNWNLVTAIFGVGSTPTDAIYILIGLAAIWEAVMHAKQCKMCTAK